MVIAILASVFAVGRTLLSKASEEPPVTTPVIRIPTTAPEQIATPTPISQVATPSSQTTVSDLIRQLQTTTPVVTETGWKIVGSGNVSVSPRFSTDNKSLYVDFLSNNFSRVTSIDYSLSYLADPQVTRMVKGSLTPATEISSGESNGVPFFRKIITIGTCSKGVCVYDSNPRGYTLKILVKENNGLNVYLITLTLTSNESSTSLTQ